MQTRNQNVNWGRPYEVITAHTGHWAESVIVQCEIVVR